MIIQIVKFKSALLEAEIRQVMEDRAPQFRALPGLLQKYYMRETQTGEVGAVYIWDKRNQYVRTGSRTLREQLQVLIRQWSSQGLSYLRLSLLYVLKSYPRKSATKLSACQNEKALLQAMPCPHLYTTIGMASKSAE